MNRAVDVRELTKRFGEFTAVDAVSFDIPKGEIFGLLGPNGAGKTTTIRMLCGILQPTSGEAEVLGHSVTLAPEAIKAKIGYMSQIFSLYNDLTVRENLDFYARIYDVPPERRKQRLPELIEMAGLSGQERMQTSNLSGAWRQRLALTCAIVHEPPMLFLDEPTAGVDPVSRREFWDLIYDLAARDVSVLTTTHYMDEAEYCNIIGMMYNARLIALSDPDTLKAEMPGILLEIDCDPLSQAESLLADHPQVIEAVPHGVLLHATIAEGRTISTVKKLLTSNGITVRNIEEISPSLEDVFITMVGEEDRAQVRQELQS